MNTDLTDLIENAAGYFFSFVVVAIAFTGIAAIFSQSNVSINYVFGQSTWVLWATLSAIFQCFLWVLLQPLLGQKINTSLNPDNVSQ